jgi:hypothetical protein
MDHNTINGYLQKYNENGKNLQVTENHQITESDQESWSSLIEKNSPSVQTSHWTGTIFHAMNYDISS